MNFFTKLFSKPSKEDILRFNYHCSFKALPTLIEKYNDGKISFEDVHDTEKYHDGCEMSKKLAKQVKTAQSGINGHPEISLTLIIPPSNGMISEVEVAMIAHNSKLHHAVVFTMEYSLGDYMVCAPTTTQHGNLGLVVSNREQFCFEVFKKSMEYWNNMEASMNPQAIF